MLSALASPLAHALSPLSVSFSTGIVLLFACAIFGSHRVLRWPLLLVAVVHVGAELLVVMVLVAVMGLWDAAVVRLRPSRARSLLLHRLEHAASWDEFLEAGRALDAASDECLQWQAEAEHPQYNAAAVARTLQTLRAARAADDVDALCEALGTCLRKSFAGIDSEALYARCHAGTVRRLAASTKTPRQPNTAVSRALQPNGCRSRPLTVLAVPIACQKRLIDTYVDEVVACLSVLASTVGSRCSHSAQSLVCTRH
jgi:hypothetical protein